MTLVTSSHVQEHNTNIYETVHKDQKKIVRMTNMAPQTWREMHAIHASRWQSLVHEAYMNPGLGALLFGRITATSIVTELHNREDPAQGTRQRIIDKDPPRSMQKRESAPIVRHIQLDHVAAVHRTGNGSTFRTRLFYLVVPPTPPPLPRPVFSQDCVKDVDHRDG